jgi:hypothetical protein
MGVLEEAEGAARGFPVPARSPSGPNEGPGSAPHASASHCLTVNHIHLHDYGRGRDLRPK